LGDSFHEDTTMGRRHHPDLERAMRAVPRERFVPDAQRAHATEDTALPIDCAQTISQPSLVAFMTDELRLSATSRVLEIGTGSGYQTAILAEIAAEVFTIERIATLAAAARSRLFELGYENIRFRIGDGARGWPEAAPFDAIIVTAAPEHLPSALVDQLSHGGRLVAPVGSTGEDNQVLIRVQKDREGIVTERNLAPVRFVPLITEQH
jgi:protein-L-isoaspartate(D-aspartate) O-methyltransferase